MKETLTPAYFLSQDSFKNWANGTNEADCQYWDGWLAAHPEHLPMATLAAMLQTKVPIAESVQGAVSDKEIAIEWKKLQIRIDRDANNHHEAKQVYLSQWWRTAAAAVIATVITGGSFWFLTTPYQVEYSAKGTERKTVHLSDGTDVTLNSNTKITAVAKWRFGAVREVWLEGEAYFKVKSHPESTELRDFIVHTHDLDVKVIGTQFNVDTRNHRTSVVLDEGKVQLNLNQARTDTSVILTPGEAAEYTLNKGATKVKSSASANQHIGDWRFGYYNFNKTTLKDVISLIEDRNDVQILLDDQSLLTETITGRVPNNNLDQAMTSLAKLFKLDYQVNGKQIVLKRKATP